MEYKEVQPTSILPGKAEKITTTKKQIVDFLLETVVKSDRDLYDLYNRNTLRSPNIIKTLVSSFENLLKAKCVKPEQRNVVTKCIDTIELQLSILENLELNSFTKSELMVVLMSTFINHLDDFLVD